MRILVVTNLYPSAAAPAFGTFVASRVDALRAHGAHVDVVAVEDSEVHARVLQKYLVLAGRCLLRVLAGRLGRRRYDLVEAHIAYPTGLVAVPTARLLGVPVVAFAHGSDVLVLPERSRRHRRLAAWVFGHADLVVANSAFIRDRVQAAFQPRAVAVVSPGVDVDRFLPAAPDAAGEAGVGRHGLLYVGRLVPEKGVATLLGALRLLGPTAADATLEVVGDGPERAGLQELAREHRLPVRFWGALPPDEVAALMARAAVVVVPSEWEEPFGIVPLEAMAAGAVVVATSVGGMAENVVDGVTGFSVAPRDPAGLAEAVAAALSAARDADGGPSLTDRARALAVRHGSRAVAEETLDVFRSRGLIRSGAP